MQFIIRPANTADLPKIHAILQPAFCEPGSLDPHAEINDQITREEISRALLSTDATLLVAERVETGHIVGFCLWRRHSVAERDKWEREGAHQLTWAEDIDPLVLRMIHEDRAHLRFFSPATHMLELGLLAVAPDAQRHGVGTALVAYGTKMANEELLVHYVLADDTSDFYIRCGFRSRSRIIINAAALTGVAGLRHETQHYLTDTATEQNGTASTRGVPAPASFVSD